ncbi:unnamed protein product [Linum trigynum]|uniref:Uncharacterized protein n=1 Tax=Linum trigynum TaxID=586398 RepID=A0AAV2GT47_9ROSI
MEVIFRYATGGKKTAGGSIFFTQLHLKNEKFYNGRLLCLSCKTPRPNLHIFRFRINEPLINKKDKGNQGQENKEKEGNPFIVSPLYLVSTSPAR